MWQSRWAEQTDEGLQLRLPGRTDEVIREHSLIVDGIEAHDPDRAARAMTRHLDCTYERSIAARRAGVLGLVVPRDAEDSTEQRPALRAAG